MQIEIIKTPSGFPPEDIQRAWIGCTMEAVPVIAAPVIGLTVIPTIGTVAVVNNVDGYSVSYQEAMTKLKLHNVKAYNWWISNYSMTAFPDGLIFRKIYCKELSN